MTAQDPSFPPKTGRGLLGWLGLGPATGTAPADQPDRRETHDAQADGADLHGLARRQLMADVGDFLALHNLEPSPFTLGIAHDYLTGAEPTLVRRINQHIHDSQPVTAEWLQDITRQADNDQREALTRLMTKLESDIEDFGHTSTAAQSAASSYNSALAAHVGELGGKASTSADNMHVMGELLALTKAMMERTRALETEMTRSVNETRALKRSLDQARRSAEQDHLTGLPNRRAFETRLTKEYASARQAGEHLIVAFCDIDNFKRINDEHGHEAGDRVLKAVATTLARISDDKCHVARHGGEEFVVLLRGHTLAHAWELLDDTRAGLAARRLVNRANDAPFGKITFSAGIADVFAFTDARAALRAADKALFRAKIEGRNRVLLAQREGSGEVEPDADPTKRER